MGATNNIFVFWWSSVLFENRLQENFGDILSKYLAEKISGKQVIWKYPKKQKWNPFKKTIYFTTGSILAHVDKSSVVWGSGIISKQDHVKEAKFLAVRGPETYNYLTQKGYKVNKVFGDPAILLPDLYYPNVEKKNKLGVIPHYIDYEAVSEWYKNNANICVINLLNNDVEAVIDQILSCENIISSSLHGVIVPHTYNIPAVWVQFSDRLFGDNIKFADYFRSVGLKPYKPKLVNEKLDLKHALEFLEQTIDLPELNTMKRVRQELMQICPFKE